MHKTRPKNLDLFTIHFPLPAIVSLLHRISGAALFILIPLILWCFGQSLTVSGFDNLQNWLGYWPIKTLCWLIIIPFCYHLVAGIRHLLSDIHIGESLKGGRMSAMLALVVSVILIMVAGIWLW